jgi:sugar fermentation stimulation protein A
MTIILRGFMLGSRECHGFANRTTARRAFGAAGSHATADVMLVPTPLLSGKLAARYQRFLMDVRVGRRTVTVHCANSGSMEGCLPEGAEVLASPKVGKGRLSHVAEWIRGPDGWIGINTHRSNAIVGEALQKRRITELATYRQVKAEVPYGENSRVDFLLTEPGLPDCYVEVKNTTWPGEEGALAFPDAVTLRGQKHLRELAARVARGDRAVLLFLANRAHGHFVRACHERDPAYAEALALAHHAGVEVLAYRTRIEPPQVTLAERLPVRVRAGGSSTRLP